MRYGIEMVKVVLNPLDANTVFRVAVLSFSGRIMLLDWLVRLQGRWSEVRENSEQILHDLS